MVKSRRLLESVADFRYVFNDAVLLFRLHFMYIVGQETIYIIGGVELCRVWLALGRQYFSVQKQ